MGNIPQAIVINASVVPATSLRTQYGVPAIVGESTYVSKDTPKAYSSLDAVKIDHGTSSKITIAAEAIFAQGSRRFYAVAINASTPGTPTATEVETALATLEPYAQNGLIHGVCLAGIESDHDTLTAKLKAFADAHNVIFAVTNPNGATVANITAKTGALSSPNGYFMAHNDADQTGDVAAAALGLLMVLKPWISPYWKDISCDVNAYFLPSEWTTLESAKANYVTDLGDHINRASQAYTTKSDSAPRFIDITRTKYYVVQVLQNAIASYRIATEKIPYTSAGIKFIEGEIRGAMESLVKLGALSDYKITMPTFDAISTEDMQQRKLSGIHLWTKLAGDIHELEMDLILEAI